MCSIASGYRNCIRWAYSRAVYGAAIPFSSCYYYHRQHLVEQSARYSSKMQKCLRLMNIRLDVVLNDITGTSGMAIIEAILSGVRDPEYLASLVSARTKRSRQEIAAALHGWWREELLFELEACLDFYKL